MKTDMDKLLKKSLTPTDVPPDRLNRMVLLKVKEKNQMMKKRRFHTAAVAAACVLTFGSVTVFAAQHYLSPAQVATEMEDNTLTKAFLSEEAVFVNETQEIGGYLITLLGSVAGRNISDYFTEDGNGIPKDDRIYTVVAIERADGTPMPDTSSDEYGKESFYVSHYIRGLAPDKYSLMSMGGGYSEFVKDGVAYRILDMDNIEMFADKGIYVGVSGGVFYDGNAYRYDESTGEMKRNTEYNGVNALFTLPVDAGKADPAAAKQYLENLQKSWDTPTPLAEPNEARTAVDEFMKKLTSENLDEYAAPVESTRQTCIMDANRYLYYTYQTEDGLKGSSIMPFDELFPDKRPGVSEFFSSFNLSEGLSGLAIEVFTLNEDGTVTFVLYRPIL